MSSLLPFKRLPRKEARKRMPNVGQLVKVKIFSVREKVCMFCCVKK